MTRAAAVRRVIRTRNALAQADAAHREALSDANLAGVSYRALADALSEAGFPASTMGVHRTVNAQAPTDD